MERSNVGLLAERKQRIFRRVALAGTAALIGAAVALTAASAAFGTPPGDTGPGDATPGHALWQEFWDNLGFIPPPLRNDEGSHTIDTPIRIGCGLYNEGISDTWSVITGHTYASVDPAPTGRFALADNWFEDVIGECGWAHPVGGMSRSSGWLLRVTTNSGYHIDRAPMDSIRSYHAVEATRYDNSACSGTVFEAKSNTSTCQPSTDGAYQGGMFLNALPYNTCDRPDLVMDVPTTSRTWYYKTQVHVQYCNVGGTGCGTWSTDVGCFALNWTN